MSSDKITLTELDIATIKNILGKSEHFVKLTNETSELDTKYLNEKDIEQIQKSLRKKNQNEVYKGNAKGSIVPVNKRRAIIRITHNKLTFEKETLERITVGNNSYK